MYHSSEHFYIIFVSFSQKEISGEGAVPVGDVFCEVLAMSAPGGSGKNMLG